METIELSRKQLYDLVWSTPISKLIQQYAISNEGLKKICKKFEIPMPQNGFWLKLKYNKKVKIEKLSPIFGGIDKIVMTLRVEGNTINVDQTPLTIRAKEIENDPNSPITVPETITKPDILTIQTKDYWKGKIKFNSYREDNRIVYPVRVGNDCKKRALLFMDAFTKLLRYRGHTWSKEYGSEGVLIDTVFIEIDLREASRRVPAKAPYSGTELEPIGEFIFKMGKYSRVREWRDGKTKVEEMLPKILAKLEIYSAEEKIQKERNRIWHLNYEAELKKKEEIKQRRNEEVEKFNNLLKLSEQYNKSLIIRKYIDAKKEKAQNENTLDQETQEWINWANDKADWLDPLINKPDDILDN
ncbi:hypothetical protein V5J73_08640 [Flavobacterium sp. KS-LB2]|uniref:hypothetical protein n=1 Tax=Flavobacterium sp. KS-LB2 TaxID=3120525 RepID=UPI0030D5EDEA